MAAIDVSNLSLNAKEAQAFSEFVIENTFNSPELSSLNTVFTGVKMKSQVVFASQFGKTGLGAGSDCARVSSGAGSELTEKFWEPAGIEDTITLCQKDVNGLFKGYYNKIEDYKQNYEIEGSDEATFLSILTLESIKPAIERIVWLGDKSVAVATSGTSGIADTAELSGDTVYYEEIDGIWAQIFDGVGTGSTDISRYTIAENTGTTTSAQALAAGRGITILENTLQNADSRLRSDSNAQFYVSRSVFDNYVNSLVDKGATYDIAIMENGLQTVSYKGYKVINMETVWIGLNDFVDNTVNNAGYNPNRCILSTPQNLPVATLNEDDMSDVESFYEQLTRTNYLAYGFSIDAMVAKNEMISVAY
ncbi:hypothetical protein DRO61_07735 [Candidatus Bathyarchaeota archaeon]|nr:MAG: hypothetical protein DRO61_07735 [Candidatus Bathyarchaeota archaeon]